MADFPPAHPGDVLREDFLKPLGLSQYAVADAIGVPQIRISEIVNGKRAVTPDTALRFARYFKTSAEFWMGMQTTYDLKVARSDREDDRRARAAASSPIASPLREGELSAEQREGARESAAHPGQHLRARDHVVADR